ncbi:NAD-dependent protein deacetylase [Halieaceae bacterium IMCC8485]|uniref:protein acetyllysine N-acetyltransferase n=1 Tax=Candidatus Seongchinamella marina TaxID=2518990 RepID=A0ABT3STW1_9GAMM|nr:NAD-dependent protein deacetylase [Candidatus Seongchinamella marina]MCX2973433.1 NAD-dependent protein deacetylase [Candidatus Seongchinamella marina]
MNTEECPTSRLVEFLQLHPKLVVLSGAGISVASGIPAYRDGLGQWQHRKPIQHNDFVNHAATRRRYWARSMAGWPTINDAQPNAAHKALTALEADGRLEFLITQNVDRLHQRAGSRSVLDLHGRLDRVRCLSCEDLTERQTMQQRLLTHNSAQVLSRGDMRPDGDSELPDTELDDFDVPPCIQCGGNLMPDVVFFGANIPRARVESSMTALDRADALLVIGSSLQVYSGFRFCKHAQATGKAIAIINPGATRADSMATLKLDEVAETLLPNIAAGVTPA